MRVRQQSESLDVFRETMIGLVRGDDPDLTARQMSIFLLCYTTRGPHTVRGLAERLRVQKPAVVRAIDRLESFELAKREPDMQDRRSVLITQTTTGRAFLRQIRGSLAAGVRSVTPPATAEEERRPTSH